MLIFLEFKKHRLRIRKKSEQVIRLRKKMRKDPRSVPDPSVQRLLDTSTKELTVHFKQLQEREKFYLRQGLLEERGRYCTFVNCLRPVIDEEFRMLQELNQVEEVMSKLAKVTIVPRPRG